MWDVGTLRNTPWERGLANGYSAISVIGRSWMAMGQLLGFGVLTGDLLGYATNTLDQADAGLTDVGISEAHKANAAWQDEINFGVPLPQTYYVSPLR